jgi:23S rRNA (adenine2503-C2)-methyltransferase
LTAGRAEQPAGVRETVHGLTRDELAAACAELGLPAFRARQVWRWLYVQRVADWAPMTNLPLADRAKLAGRLALALPAAEAVEGEAGETRKLLLGLADGERIEAVLIPARDRQTVCLSTQVGCRYRCAFCASGQAGLLRNLTAGEIVGELLAAAAALGEVPGNVVYMGIGEPFDNYDAVLKSVRILNDPEGLAIGARHITISTSGVIPGMDRLAEEGLQVELSVSLHAPDDALRSELMPINRQYPLAGLMDACARYVERTNRIITFEYTLIRGVNDTRGHAERLAALVRRVRGRVNLLPLSPVEGYEGLPPEPGTAERFVTVLERAGVNATVRASKGCRIRAACGQLRMRSREGRLQSAATDCSRTRSSKGTR